MCCSVCRSLKWVIDIDSIFENRLYFYFQAANLKRDVIPIGEVKRFIVDCFTALKTPTKHAESMADLLVAADYRGHFSHGMNRLEMYLNDLEAGTMDGAAEPTILKVFVPKIRPE